MLEMNTIRTLGLTAAALVGLGLSAAHADTHELNARRAIEAQKPGVAMMAEGRNAIQSAPRRATQESWKQPIYFQLDSTYNANARRS
jgi:hypothetical protein